MPHTYEYPRPAYTADLAVFARMDGETRVLLIRRKHEPFAGRWALPGGFVDEGETALSAAVRELKEEAGLDVSSDRVEPIGLFDAPGRDPRGWTISAAFLHVVGGDVPEAEAGDDAAEVAWLHPLWLDGPREGRPPEGPPADRLAFDHAEILRRAMSLAPVS